MKKLPRKRSYDSLILIFPFQEKQFYPTKPRHLSFHYRSFARRYKTSSFSIERLAKETSEARIQRDFSNGCTWRMIKSLRHARPCRVSRSSARWRAISQNRVTCTPRFINYSSQSYHGPRIFIRAFIFFFFSSTSERRGHLVPDTIIVPRSNFSSRQFFLTVSLLPYTRTARVS